MDVRTASYFIVRQCARFIVSYRNCTPDTVRSNAFRSLDRALAWAEENTPLGETFLINGRDEYGHEYLCARGVC